MKGFSTIQNSKLFVTCASVNCNEIMDTEVLSIPYFYENDRMNEAGVYRIDFVHDES